MICVCVSYIPPLSHTRINPSILSPWTLIYFRYGKPVIPLHFFHHMTTFTMAAFTHNFPVGGFAFLNAAVHFVMYLHYSHPVRWARPFITTSQLVQFVCVISVHTYAFLQPAGSGCFDFSAVAREWWYCQLVVVGYFLLFCKFFVDNYVKKEKPGERKGGKGKRD